MKIVRLKTTRILEKITTSRNSNKIFADIIALSKIKTMHLFKRESSIFLYVPRNKLFIKANDFTKGYL